MSPLKRSRGRQRFAFGALEQLATIFGAVTASVLTIRLLLPALNSIGSAPMFAHSELRALARLVIGFSACTALAAIVLRGLGRLLEDDGERKP